MKICTLLLGLMLCVIPAQAQSTSQPPFAPLGKVHTPTGPLRVLVIFVRYDNHKGMRGSKRWPDKSEEGILPRMATGNSNALFHQSADSIRFGKRKKNLSDYYYTMSGGKFLLTADIFPIQVPIRFIPQRGGNFFSRQSQMNQAAIDWIAAHYPDFDWGKYDHRTNHPNYERNNEKSAPDSVLDYVVFMHRDFGSTGMGSSGNLRIPGSKFVIRDGHTGIRSYADAKHNWEYFKHEFAHNLYGCPHYLGANNADGLRYYTQKGWGMMAAWHSAFFTANAWESWWMGWLDIQEPTQNGTYLLKDYVTGRDAIRIQIPGTQDYIWLENHQKKDLWDDKIFYTDPKAGHPVSAPGIYAYVVAGPGSNRQKPQLNPFSKQHANMIRMLNGEGNFDIVFNGDSARQGKGTRWPVFRKAAPNPFAGQNDFQLIRWDMNRDGRMGVGMQHGNKDNRSREELDVWAEQTESGVRFLNCTGDEADALSVGDSLGLSGIFPLSNYPEFNPGTETLSPYYLNGLSIKVLEQLEDGSFRLDIRFDNWDVFGTHRWAGPLILFKSDTPIPPLQLQKGAEIKLDLSGTPDRLNPHPISGTLSNPSYLRVESGRAIHLERKSEMHISRHSKLDLKKGSELRIKRGAVLRLSERGTLEIEEGATVIVEKGGRIILEKGAIWPPELTAHIELAAPGGLKDRRKK